MCNYGSTVKVGSRGGGIINCQKKSYLPVGDICILLCQINGNFVAEQVRKRKKHATEKARKQTWHDVFKDLCDGLNFLPLPDSYVEALTFKVMICGSGALDR